MSIRIDKKIVGFAVVKDEQKPIAVLAERPPVLEGITYKLKTPLSDSALYITITNYQGRPFEMFINSKAMEHFQWIVALTRIISAVFRQGGEVNFLIEELRSVFDPKGGYFHKGRYVPSLVAAIGDIVEQHLIGLGLYQPDTSLQEAAVQMIQEKQQTLLNEGLADDHGSYPDSASLCGKCQTKAVVLMDGCATCLSCGDSKCN